MHFRKEDSMTNPLRNMSLKERVAFARKHHIALPSDMHRLAKQVASSEETQRFLKAHRSDSTKLV